MTEVETRDVQPPRHEWEWGTKWLFGKPYHWAVIDGRHALLRGPAPYEPIFETQVSVPGSEVVPPEMVTTTKKEN